MPRAPAARTPPDGGVDPRRAQICVYPGGRRISGDGRLLDPGPMGAHTAAKLGPGGCPTFSEVC